MTIFGFRLRTRYRCEPSPPQFHELAEYNARKWKGILHDPATVERMALLRAQFDQWQREANMREGIIAPGSEGAASA